MSELVMRKIDGKNKLFKKTVKKCDDKEEKGEKHDGPKEEKAEQKEHKEHPEFSKKDTDKIAHDHVKMGKGGGGMDRAHRGLNDWMDEHEGKKKGDSNKHIMEERKRQGYDDANSEKTIKTIMAHTGASRSSATKQLGEEHERSERDKIGKGGGGGERHGKKAKKLSFAAYSAKKWEKK
jgi:NACalpha-BTF3-like transcription factor